LFSDVIFEWGRKVPVSFVGKKLQWPLLYIPVLVSQKTREYRLQNGIHIPTRLGFSEAESTYLTGTCGIDSLDEIAHLNGIEDVDTMIKWVTNLGGTVMTGEGTTTVTSCNNGIPVSIRAVANLKLCVYYLKHMERVHRQPIPNVINLVLVSSYCDQQRHEVGFNNTAEEPEINDKD
jgi:hypothetical protein